MEFYFSDANLPTDRKLLKMIRKDAHGYGEGWHQGLPRNLDLASSTCLSPTTAHFSALVPVKLFSNFRKIRTLTKDVEVIARSLLTSQVRQMRRLIFHRKLVLPLNTPLPDPVVGNLGGCRFCS